MSFSNTMKCFDKRRTTKLNTIVNDEIVPPPLAEVTEISQIKTILAEIGVEQENIAKLSEPENNCEIFSPRRGLDLTAIKTKKLELEKSIKEYTRPEKPAKPLRLCRPEYRGAEPKPRRGVTAKIANKKVENNK
jgi:hypothetical protein